MANQIETRLTVAISNINNNKNRKNQTTFITRLLILKLYVKLT